MPTRRFRVPLTGGDHAIPAADPREALREATRPSAVILPMPRVFQGAGNAAGGGRAVARTGMSYPPRVADRRRFGYLQAIEFNTSKFKQL
jgi:hypothetical protein